jgi:RNA polymerase sigma factor (TIGR02999 family)
VSAPGDAAAGPPGDVTRLLHEAADGDRAAYDRLFTVAYDELRRVAELQLRGRGSVSAAELVSELYLKLGDQVVGDPGGGARGRAPAWQGRAHFYAVATRAVRQLLVDLARRQQAAKRGGAAVHTTLSGKDVPDGTALEDVLAMDAALAELDERQRRVVEYRFFGGLTDDEIGQALGVSSRTVHREWVRARARLYRAMYDGAGEARPGVPG